MKTKSRVCVTKKLPALVNDDHSGSLSALLENMPGAVYCCRDDAEATVEFVSDTVHQITGYAADDLMSHRISWMQLVHPDDRIQVLQQIATAASTREPWSLEYRVRHARGEDRWVWDRGRGVFDNQGLVCLQGFVSDVTDRHHTQEQVRRSEERFRATFENAAVGIAHVGLDGRWLRVNERLARIVGYTSDELREKTFGDITHPDDLDADWAQVAMLIAGQIPNYSMEKRYFRKDGSTVWINLTVAMVRKPTGEPDYFISVVEDIELRKQAERALQERTAEAEQRAAQLRALTAELISAEDLERRRIAQLLHDHLQQLLVAARLSAQSAEADLPQGDTRDKLERVKGLIDDSICESRSLTTELSPSVLYNEGLMKALAWLRRWMREKHGLTVTVSCETEYEPADEQTRVLLFQSVRELLFNVVKHAGVCEAGVSVTAEDDRLRIVVTDRGRGFDPASVDDAATDRGFGHFAIRERLAMIGGHFKVRSFPGSGTHAELAAPLQLGTAGDTVAA